MLQFSTSTIYHVYVNLDASFRPYPFSLLFICRANLEELHPEPIDLVSYMIIVRQARTITSHGSRYVSEIHI